MFDIFLRQDMLIRHDITRTHTHTLQVKYATFDNKRQNIALKWVPIRCLIQAFQSHKRRHKFISKKTLIKINPNQHAYQIYLVNNINTILCISQDFTSYELLLLLHKSYKLIKMQIIIQSYVSILFYFVYRIICL